MEEILNLKGVEWSANAENVLLTIYSNDLDSLECVKADVVSGVARLWEVTQRGKTCGYIVGRIDAFATNTKEFVIVSAVATVKGVDLFDVCLPVLEKRARLAGCKGVRYHATRKFGAFQRKAEKAGYEQKEIVYYKGL